MNSNLILKKERRKERPKAISGEYRAGSCLYHINRSVEKISEGLDHQFTRRSEREIFEKKNEGLDGKKEKLSFVGCWEHVRVAQQWLPLRYERDESTEKCRKKKRKKIFI